MGPVDTTEREAERIAQNPYKRRFDLRVIDGVLHLKARLRVDEIRHELHWQDGDLPLVCAHGTLRKNVDGILEHGLVAGGMGSLRRKQTEIFLVLGSILGCEERDGVRIGSEVAVEVNIKKALRHGMEV